MSEIWKDIKRYEGLYQVSNIGKIKRIGKNERIKKTFIDKNGYERVELSKLGVNKKYSVHRLVAEAFINNCFNKKEINHKNGIKTDNRVENLEWVTRSENELHAYRTKLAQNSIKQREAVSLWCKKNKTKPIVQLTLDNKFVKIWNSAIEVQKQLNINRKNISQCITGRNKTAGGYKWLTKERFNNIMYKVVE